MLAHDRKKPRQQRYAWGADYNAVARVARRLAAAVIVLASSSAFGHDWKRPNLDNWFQSLRRPHTQTWVGGTSCCSKQDCHITDAELRDDGNGHYSWWARYGTAIDHDGVRDWELGEWVKVPDEIIVRSPTGNPVRNEAGEARAVPQSSEHQESPGPGCCIVLLLCSSKRELIGAQSAGNPSGNVPTNRHHPERLDA